MPSHRLSHSHLALFSAHGVAERMGRYDSDNDLSEGRKGRLTSDWLDEEKSNSWCVSESIERSFIDIDVGCS